ncbi:hypothetical protein [Enterovibrio norvegicus]|uniref:Uncharacterized protein n=1 Tax=Enterovibrio norvegicus TaxID=188144 RepID=A0A2N7L4Y1_9GAMM|nr:hypothetical protein [Enterovibrio norvegicus]PML76092.1 hypothetical protein BCT69_05450 [Enterovibrio norvegicus]PMN88448.1 hypothetical protein BCT23_24025 [Enterovibrio norvegicus]
MKKRVRLYDKTLAAGTGFKPVRAAIADTTLSHGFCVASKAAGFSVAKHRTLLIFYSQNLWVTAA